MIDIRRLKPEDRSSVMNLHRAMGFDYELDMAKEPFVIQHALFNGSPEPRVVVLGKATIEAYLLLDRTWATPQDRWDAVARLVTLGENQARIMGFNEAHATIPPEVEPMFRRRLAALGWKKNLWPLWSKEL